MTMPSPILAEDNPVRFSRVRKFPQISGLAIHESKSCAFYRALRFGAIQFLAAICYSRGCRIGTPLGVAVHGLNLSWSSAAVKSWYAVCFADSAPNCNRFSTGVYGRHAGSKDADSPFLVECCQAGPSLLPQSRSQIGVTRLPGIGAWGAFGDVRSE
jgi:hypothetical protein